MITRIEIDGFKSFDRFAVDLRPFTAVIGTNAGGKSNLLDALAFLRGLVQRSENSPLHAAAAARGGLKHMFRQLGDGTVVRTMRLAVEVLLDPREGGAGLGETLPSGLASRWRYEVALERGAKRVQIVDERLQPIDPERDTWFDLVGATPTWRSAFALREKSAAPAPAPTARELSPTENAMAALGIAESEGGIQRTGPSPRSLPADGLVRHQPFYSVLMAKVLQLHERALRMESDTGGDGVLESDGFGLPGFLHMLGEDDDALRTGPWVLAAVRADLGRLVKGITGFEVVEDDRRHKLWIELTARDEPPFPAELASDGTLRALAILGSLREPESGPLIVEEPENGLYPERLLDLLQMMRDAASAPALDEPDDPLRQVIITSHSPLVLDVVPPEDIVFLDTVTEVRDGIASRVTRARRVQNPDEPTRPEDHGRVVRQAELDAFRTGRGVAA
ncbi:AAA family ATPase [Kitasatospora sp. NPDC006697]|uniref:AAA family ATPase n=1 Tax=Kitasatospora sp. NPDC006697 TaxID=3364020 RepID=UPI00368287EF